MESERREGQCKRVGRERKKKEIWTVGLSLSSLKGEINQCSEEGAVLCE